MFSKGSNFVLLTFLLAWGVSLAGPSMAEELSPYTKDKKFEDLTPAEHTAAKAVARTKKLTALRVCADPGNMPMSNSRAEGFQNKIIEAIGRTMETRVIYFWRPYLERGLTRETFDNRECDVLLDMPADYESVLTTIPIYRSTYVLAYRSDSRIDIGSLDDPELKTLRIGVFQHSGMREALVRRGISNLEVHAIAQDADLNPKKQPWRQVQEVVDGDLDIAAVWGPFAGYVKTMKGAPLVIKPVNLMEDDIQLEFELAIGMRKNNVVLKYMLDNAIDTTRDEIERILRDYGVPLVACSRCAVQGDLPSHGSYYRQLRQASPDRFLKEPEHARLTDKATPDQKVTRERLEEWLGEGADVTQELSNAVLASDTERAVLLVENGADVNARDAQGYAPLHTAAANRNSSMITWLLGRDADPNLRDGDGFTPLLHAVMRNHVPSVQALAAGGADLETPTMGQLRPLAVAIEEGMMFAAEALMELGVDVNSRSGREGLTPLMVTAIQHDAEQRTARIIRGPTPTEIGKDLIGRGADVNACSKDGVTALMIAAGQNNVPMLSVLVQAGADLTAKSAQGKTALDIAEAARNAEAIGSLKLFASLAINPKTAHRPTEDCRKEKA